MPFVKIHVSSEIVPSVRQSVANDVREAVVEVLGIGREHSHVVVYDSSPSSRSVHESRDNSFIFVEILMFSGRTDEMKEHLFAKICQVICKDTGTDGSDILMNVIDTDRSNWAGRGGIPMSKINL